MGTRKGKVEMVSPVSIGDDSSPAWQIDTDLLSDPSNRSFFIARSEPAPTVGTLIEFGDHHVWYEGHQAHKLGLNFDPFAPLH